MTLEWRLGNGKEPAMQSSERRPLQEGNGDSKGHRPWRGNEISIFEEHLKDQCGQKLVGPTGLGNNLDFITSKGESGGGKNLCAGRDRRELFQDSLKGGGSAEHPLGAACSTPDEVCQLKGR